MTIDECIVYCRKTSSEFHYAIKQLRREKKYHKDIYQQLPDRCCSCNGQIGLKTIDLKTLRKMCHDMLFSWSIKAHVPFSKNLNKLILTERSKPKKNKISKDQMKDRLEEPWEEYDCGCWISKNRCARYLMQNSSISIIKDKPTQEINECNVNSRRDVYQSNGRRRQQVCYLSNFIPTITSQLSQESYSSDEEEDMKLIDRTRGNDMYDEITPRRSVRQPSQASNNFISLPSKYQDTFDERRRKIGILIGKKGRYIRALENKYNVRVNVVIDTSSAQLRQNLTRLLNHDRIRYDYSNRTVYVLLSNIDMSTAASETIVNEIKQTLIDKWNKINESQVVQ